MKISAFLLLFTSLLNPSGTHLVFDFGSSPNKTSDWIMISDRIMGGVTQSKLEYNDNAMRLSGSISLANYGGFASVKTKFNAYDLSGYKGVKIRFKATNQQFAFTLEASRYWTYPYFKGDFSRKKDNTWEEAVIYFSDFKEYQIGDPTGEKLPQSTLKNIVRLGIITTEKKEGPFSIEVDSIEFIN